MIKTILRLFGETLKKGANGNVELVAKSDGMYIHLEVFIFDLLVFDIEKRILSRAIGNDLHDEISNKNLRIDYDSIDQARKEFLERRKNTVTDIKRKKYEPFK